MNFEHYSQFAYTFINIPDFEPLPWFKVPTIVPAKYIIACIVVVVVLAIAVWLIRPLFVNRQVHETLPSSNSSAPEPATNPAATGAAPAKQVGDSSMVVAAGTFVGTDSFHKASGGARLIQRDGKTFVQLADDFSVTNGPDLFVIFGKDGVYDGSARLGPLKGNIGQQFYEVPASLDPARYNEVWIWCRAFNVPFGHARLN